MIHENNGEHCAVICREIEEDEIAAEAMYASRKADPPTCEKCWAELGKGSGGYCFDREIREREERGETAFGRGVLGSMGLFLLCVTAFGQTSYSGMGSWWGNAVSGGTVGLAPMTYSARVDTCETGTETGPLGCAPNPANPVSCPSCSGPATALPLTFTGSAIAGVPGANQLPVPGATGSVACGSLGAITQPTNNQYLCGINTMITDPDFNTEMTRATDYSMAPAQGLTFNMGSDGTPKWWSSDSPPTKLFITNSGGAYALLAFNSAQWGQTPGPVTVSSIYGVSQVYGQPAFSGPLSSTPQGNNVFYVLNTTQESTVLGTVTSGTCLTPETVKQGSLSATLRAVNSTFAQFGIVSGSGGAWTGQTSGCTFTATSVPPVGSANTPCAVTIYKGIINAGNWPSSGGTPPTQWAVAYSLLFNFDYTSTLAGTGYGPTSANSCLPANFRAYWTGEFQNSNDDRIFGSSVGDNGQDGYWGPAAATCATSSPDGHGWNGNGVCAGATYDIEFKPGSGCRVWNTHTDQVWGDWGTSGQATDGQYHYIAGTISGTPTQLPSGIPLPGVSGALLIQDSTGAKTEFKAAGYIVSATSPSGYSYQQLRTDTQQTATLWKTGVIYGTADATHAWRAQDGSGAYITPSALPQPAPFYYPAPMHSGFQNDAATTASIDKNAVSSFRVLTVSANASTHLTTITLAGNDGSASPAYANTIIGQDMGEIFNQLAGAHDTYLNCTNANNCPTWVVYSGTNNTGSTGTANNYTIVIVDNVATASYTDDETTAACYNTPLGKTGSEPDCPMISPAGPGFDGGSGFSFFNNPMYWITSSTQVNTCLNPQCQGHGTHGYTGDARGTPYDWINISNPSTPCVNSSGVAVVGYTPCPVRVMIFHCSRRRCPKTITASTTSTVRKTYRRCVRLPRMCADGAAQMDLRLATVLTRRLGKARLFARKTA